MNCPSCGGPTTQGFSIDKFYCVAECDLKGTPVTSPVEAKKRYFVYWQPSRLPILLNQNVWLFCYPMGKDSIRYQVYEVDIIASQNHTSKGKLSMLHLRKGAQLTIA